MKIIIEAIVTKVLTSMQAADEWCEINIIFAAEWRKTSVFPFQNVIFFSFVEEESSTTVVSQ